MNNNIEKKYSEEGEEVEEVLAEKNDKGSPSHSNCDLTPALKKIIESIASGESSIADYIAAQASVLCKASCASDVVKINESIQLILVYLLTFENLTIKKLETACKCEDKKEKCPKH